MRRFASLALVVSFASACASAPPAGSGAEAAPPPPTAESASPGEDASLRHARELLRRVILIDGHNDLPWAIREQKGTPRDVAAYDLRKRTAGHTDLARIAAGGLGGQFWSVYIPAHSKERAWAREQLEQIDIAHRMIDRYPDRLAFAWSADDVERAFKSGRVASMLGIEGGHAIEGSLGVLRAYRALGVRYMTLTHSSTIEWADSGTDAAKHDGLTRFGEEVVREMNRLGMLVDLSHASPATMDDALRVSEAPVIFSHAGARAVCDHKRNVPDDILARLSKNRGVLMVIFESNYISQERATAFAPVLAEYKRRVKDIEDDAEREKVYDELSAAVVLPKATIGQVADHIEHVRKVAGVDAVGIGSDFDGGIDGPPGLEDVSGYPNLFAELIRRGWKDEDLEKLAGKNILRVMREAESVAQRLQASRPPSLATIEELDGPKPAAGP